MPELPSAIEVGGIMIPVDMEPPISLTGGHAVQGETTLDQLYPLRPVPGWASYRTTIPGLRVCGAGTHPGGGVAGAPGAARPLLAPPPRAAAAGYRRRSSNAAPRSEALAWRAEVAALPCQSALSQPVAAAPYQPA